MKNTKLRKEELSLSISDYQKKLMEAKNANTSPQKIAEIKVSIKQLQAKLRELPPLKRGRKAIIRPEPLPDIIPPINMPIPIEDIPKDKIVEIDNLKSSLNDPFTTDWLPLRRWVDFILKTLLELDKPMTTKQLLQASIPVFDLNEDNVQRAKASIARALHKLSNRNGKIKKYPIIGKRGYNYCMPEWFNNKGELKAKYLKKAN